MVETLQAIVLSKIKHNDKSNILTVFTRTRGRMVFVAPTGGGKTRKMKNVMYQPLSMVEIITDIKENEELHRIKQISSLYPYKELYFNPLKNIVAVFIADFLNHVLRESPPDKNLWHYIVDSLKFFDITDRGVANFHIAFLYTTTAFFGIQPDLSTYVSGAVFDMQSGCFSSLLPSHSQYVKSDEAVMLPLLDRINFANFHRFRFSRNERNRILDTMLKYYELHIPGVSSMKSPDVLKTIFS